jgi:hypothetical protein
MLPPYTNKDSANLGTVIFFRVFLDAVELAAPKAFESTSPFMKRTDGSSLCAIDHVSALPTDANQSYIPKNAKVFRDGGLFHLQTNNDLANSTLLKS